MTSLPKATIEQSLKQKGFIPDPGSRDHTFYHFWHKGKASIIRTKISHGSGYRDYGTDLLKSMKRQLRLDTFSQVYKLLKCPMTQKEYIDHLVARGVIPND